MRKRAPAKAVIVVHNPKGAFEVCYKGFSRKAYAWTKRGMPATVATVLLYLWSLHEELTLEKPPFDLQRVQAVAAGTVAA